MIIKGPKLAKITQKFSYHVTYAFVGYKLDKKAPKIVYGV